MTAAILGSAEVYDPNTGQWTTTDSLDTARYNHTTTLLPDGRVLVTGGVGAAYLSSAELYDPVGGAAVCHRQHGRRATVAQRNAAAERQGAGGGRV